MPNRLIAKVNDIAGYVNPNTYLTNFSMAFMQDATRFIAGRASSNIPVLLEAGKFNVYPAGYFWRDEAAVRPLGGRPVQVGYAVQEGTYTAEEWALEHTVDDRQRKNVRSGLNLDENATRLLTGKQMIRADRLWAQKFFGTGKWGMEMNGVASAPQAGVSFLKWGNTASTPLEDVEGFKETIRLATGMEPNTFILGSTVKNKLKNHPELIERMKYTSDAVITDAVLARMFEVDDVIVARSIYNSAAERMPNDQGGGKNFQYIADPNSALLAYIDPNPVLDSPTAIATFSWTGLVPGQTNDFGGIISRGRDPRAYSDYFHNRMAYGMGKVSDDLAVFLNGAV